MAPDSRRKGSHTHTNSLAHTHTHTLSAMVSRATCLKRQSYSEKWQGRDFYSDQCSLFTRLLTDQYINA